MKFSLSIFIIYMFISIFSSNAQTDITVNVSKKGEIFEGIGALSAGASSKLLIDYPEPYRSQILDLLFKPKFGASLNHFKIEIGGDVNSTCGSEPAVAHTRNEFLSPKPEYYTRGYEFWLMKEAYKRNPSIMFDALQWGAPSWIGNGNFYSQDNIDYLVKFIQLTKKFTGIDIDYVGIWNERNFLNDYPLNTDYAIKLKNELLKQNINTKLIAFDEAFAMNCAEIISKDTALQNAIDVIGSHYIYQAKGSYKKEFIEKSGKPVWASEDGPWRGDWTGAKDIIKRFNVNYIDFRMTKTIIWSLITSYYDILPLPGSGLMKANEPWNGHFEVQPALWACAHFTQFTSPGWVYLPDACGYTPDKSASYTTLISPEGNDCSIILETIDAKNSQEVNIKFDKKFDNKQLYIWKTDSLKHFQLVDKIKLTGNKLSYSFDKQSIYSISTTHGQMKGSDGFNSPASQPFVLPYSDNFENYQNEALPKYTIDQAGAFEVKTLKGNKVLKQAAPSMGIEWHYHFNPDPYTILGDMNMDDYEIGIDFMLKNKNESVSCLGRINEVLQHSVEPPKSYWTRIETNGKWVAGKTTDLLLREHTDIRKNWPSAIPYFKDHTHNFKIFSYEEILRLDKSIIATLKGVDSLYKHDANPKTLKLMLGFEGDFVVYREQHLKEGKTKIKKNAWNRVKMRFDGKKVSAFLNGTKLYEIEDDTYVKGLAGFGSGWHEAYFDNLEILPIKRKLRDK